MLKENEPAAVMVPARTPVVGFRVVPGGRVPVDVKPNGAVPAEGVIVVVYADPTVAQVGTAESPMTGQIRTV